MNVCQYEISIIGVRHANRFYFIILPKGKFPLKQLSGFNGAVSEAVKLGKQPIKFENSFK